ncbi:hypothetical protein VTL71DRAFT_5259 [Oculimacula yallundae]|uniref:Uncharacterized protein n=1 Tax=Oculimacula yallundae TaxID=86028 RepID=A0ABR4C280_9HELO
MSKDSPHEMLWTGCSVAPCSISKTTAACLCYTVSSIQPPRLNELYLSLSLILQYFLLFTGGTCLLYPLKHRVRVISFEAADPRMLLWSCLTTILHSRSGGQSSFISAKTVACPAYSSTPCEEGLGQLLIPQRCF